MLIRQKVNLITKKMSAWYFSVAIDIRFVLCYETITPKKGAFGYNFGPIERSKYNEY
jgi:hypothetical protein